MLTIVQRGGAVREKPPEVVRGFSSRLPWAWDSLCFAVPFNDPTRDSARDLIYNVAPSGVFGTLTWSRDNHGSPVAWLDDNAWIEYPDTPVHNRASSAITAYVRFRRAATVAALGAAGLFTKEKDASLFQDSWGIAQRDSGGHVLAASITVNGGTNHYWETTYVTTTTEWVSAFLRWRSGESPTLYLLSERGTVLNSGSLGTNVSGTIDYNTGKPVRINAANQLTDNFNADYSQAMIWSRKLTDTELQSLVADPYGWYSPRRETVGVSSPYPLAFLAGEMRSGSGGLR